MPKLPLQFYVTVAGTLLATLAPTALGQAVKTPTLNEKLQTFRQHSIFSREALRYTSENDLRARRNTEVPPPAPIFTGVLDEQSEFQAFLEDSRTGRLSLVKIGQTIPQGRIEEITLDYLTLRTSDGQLRKVTLGRTLTGEVRTSRDNQTFTPNPGPATTEPAISGGDGGGGPTPIVDLSDPVERMKAKRRAEMQGGAGK